MADDVNGVMWRGDVDDDVIMTRWQGDEISG